MLQGTLTEQDKAERLYFFVQYKVINPDTRMLDYRNRQHAIDCELADGAKEEYATPRILREGTRTLKVCIYLGDKVHLDEHGHPTFFDADVLDPCERKLREEGYEVIR